MITFVDLPPGVIHEYLSCIVWELSFLELKFDTFDKLHFQMILLSKLHKNRHAKSLTHVKKQKVLQNIHKMHRPDAES